MAVQGIIPPKFQPVSHEMGTLSHTWREFKDELELYFIASGQANIEEKQKVSLLLYQMGKAYMKVYNNFEFEDDTMKNNFSAVCEQFTNYFEPRKLTKSYITKFQARRQHENETISEYITELKRLSKLCDFGEKESEMVCVQISNGVRSEILRKKLWDEDLGLQDVIKKCQAYEMRQEHFPQNSTVHTVRQSARQKFTTPSRPHHFYRPSLSRRSPSNSGPPSLPRYPQSAPSSSHRSPPGASNTNFHRSSGRAPVKWQAGPPGQQHVTKQPCRNCGTIHSYRQCPAYGKKCNFCHKMNHFQKCCRKQVMFLKTEITPTTDCEQDSGYEQYTLEEEVENLNIFVVNNFNEQCIDKNCNNWTVVLKTPYMNGTGAVKMLIDTQAQCNTMSFQTFSNMAQNSDVTLEPSTTNIKAFGNTIVKPIGKVTFEVSIKNTTFPLTCEVVKGDNIPNLLSAEDSVRLGLIRRSDSPKENLNEVFTFQTQNAPSNVPIDNTFLRRIPNYNKVPSTIIKVLTEFKDRFPEEAIGCIPGEIHLSIDPEYKDGPISFGSRPIPLALKEKAKEQLDYLENQGIIAKVPQGVPTPWCSQLHMVHKKDKQSVRICIDPKFLNRAILRECHPIRTIEDILCQVDGSKYFTVLDANMGFFQVQLDYESQLLCSFNTPWGRYMYKRLPMGIKSSPEIYQRKIEEMYANVDHFANVFDDMLLFSEDVEKQSQILRKVLETARENNLTFRLSKCKFAQTEVEYSGFILTDKGVKASPEKTKAILDMPEPKNKEEVRTLLGMATYLSKHISHFSDITHDLREVIKDRNSFFFDEPQRQAFNRLKKAMASTPVMGYYSKKDPITVTCDASSVGLGAFISQNEHPIAYASKALTDTEKAYAMIEKELLAIVFACNKFHHLLYGRNDVTIVTDHLPLVNIVNKPLSQVPMRLQKMLLKLQPYSFTLIGKSGKDIPIADALSRAPLKCYYPNLMNEMKDCHVCATEVISTQAFSENKLAKLKETTSNDPDLQKLSEYIVNGWPSKRSECINELKPYWDFKDELTNYDGIIFKGERVVIPHQMQHEILHLIHYSHQGMVKSKQLARDVVYWKGMNSQIEDIVSKCSTCQTFRNNQQKEPMMSTTVPTLPFQYVSADLFDLFDDAYIVVIDHFSNYIDVEKLESKHSTSVIKILKKIFSTHGIPQKFYSDCGTQFTSHEFTSFAKEWNFSIQLFSPTHSQANGLAEKAVSIAKNLLKKSKEENKDFHLALLDYRNTPRDHILGSPVQRCMGRRTRTRLPITNQLLKPTPIPVENVTRRLEESKAKSKTHYDKHVKTHSDLQPNKDIIRYRTGKTWSPAKLIEKTENPRSYKLQTPTGRTIVRNRKHLLKTKESPYAFDSAEIDHNLDMSDYLDFDDSSSSPNHPNDRNHIQHDAPLDINVPQQFNMPNNHRTTRSGRSIRPPRYLSDYVQ